MKIWYSPYQLYPKYSLNNRMKTKFRKGALLRVRFEDESVGYADVCPFPEMGDRPLEMELKQITLAKPSALGTRSLYFSKLDAEARSRGVSLFDPKIRIRNHFLIPDISFFDLTRVEDLLGGGYTHFKIKLGRDLNGESTLLSSLVQLVERSKVAGASEMKLRLDFNAGLSRERFEAWLDKNLSVVRPYLDFIEDPFTYDAREWKTLSTKHELRFALDRAADPVATTAAGADVVVIKPAVQDSDLIVRKLKDAQKQFVLTHYMDFPIGQMGALVAAQKIMKDDADRVLICGLQHHDIYEGFTFQEEIRSDGPFIIPPEGLGIGFDDLLERQTWTEL